jgi:membrane protease YdiL (CAAX protease family)
MMRKPAFWITLALFGLLGAVTAVRLFPVAFPLLAVDIEMDRGTALDEARSLADRFEWGPADLRQAASFGRADPTFQTYLELEGGGLEELNRRVSEGVFALYAWRVRHFSHGVVEEAEVRFTPAGEPYGFSLLLSEDALGTNLPPDQAQELAVSAASRDWGVDPTLHELLESSEEEQPGGRVDHTFVFHRTDLDLGEAELRLRLRVAGDRLAEVTRFAHVPEAFERNYQSTRDANNAIWLAGTIVFVLLFLGLGGVGGTIHLIREGWIEWKKPLVWGGVVAGLMALSSVNSLPLAWMQYDTAMSPSVFIGTATVSAGLVFLMGAAFLAFVFMAGESLLRKGFPDHLQQWKLWSPGVANSTSALGLTTAPYLILGLKLGYVVLFYMTVTRFFGWWSPASSLVEPDMLATYLPWLPAVSTSLFAAFWEESVFRAIPIGVAAILGRRYGKPWVWIWSAVVLQAIVFGASHANYPQQPYYARVVEIVPTYLAWGVICVFFGLIPSIIGHFTYDLALFSIPLFAADTPGIMGDRIIVVGIGLLPLAILLLARWRQGGVSHAPQWARNRSWMPASARETEEPIPPEPVPPEPVLPEPVFPEPVPPEVRTPTGSLREGKPPLLAAAALGVLGVVLWASTLRIDEAPRFELSRTQAESAARGALEAEGVSLGEEWTPLFSLAASQGLSHEFAWQKGSPEEYGSLVGRFLDPPHWQVQFVRFGGDPVERAEEYLLRLQPSGDLLELRHELPEARPGASLEEEEARTLALAALESRLAVAPRAVREISAEEIVRPNRTDWTFTFSATEGYPFEAGEGRLTVRIAGDEITGGGTSVHIPEEWEREWRGDQETRFLAMVPLGAILFLLLLAAVVLSVIRGARGTLEMPPLRILAGTLLVAGLLTSLNKWPATLGGFGAEEAFSNQLGMALFGMVMGIGFMAGGVALLGALAHTWLRDRDGSVAGAMWWGLGLGSAAAGTVGLISSLVSAGPPDWPGFSSAVSYLPWVSVGVVALTDFLGGTAVALLLLAFIQFLRGKGRGWMVVPLLIVLGLTLSPTSPGSSWAVWGAVGFLFAGGIGLVGFLCLRFGWAILPGLMAAPILLEQVEVILARPFPGSVFGGVFGLILVAAAMTYWTRALQAPGPDQGLS